MVVLARFQSAIQMRDKIHVLDLDKLSTYDQDDLLQSVFVILFQHRTGLVWSTDWSKTENQVIV